MENNSQNNAQISKPTQDDNGLDLKNLIYILINNWLWFAISIVLCLAIAAVLYKSTPKSFQRTGTVLLRDDSKH